MAKKTERIKLWTPVFRVSFPQLFEAKAYGNQDPKYSVVGLVQTSCGGRDKERLKAMYKAAEKISIEKFGEAAFRKMRKLGKFRWPFRDGEEKELEGYGSGVIFFTMSSKMAPGVIGRNKEPLEEKDVYAGCYAHATVTPYTFDNESKGVAFGLNNVQKVGDGEAFTQRTTADEDFDEVDDDTWIDDYVAETGESEGTSEDMFT